MTETNQPPAPQTYRVLQISQKFLEAVAADWIRERSREESENTSPSPRKAVSGITGITAESRRRSKLLENAAAVNGVFLASLRRIAKGVGISNLPASATIAHLPANDIAAIQKSLRQTSGSKRDSAERNRYLYRLLLRLHNESLLTFTLPVFTEEKPPRTLAFDALNPNLPPVALLRIWQEEIADYALDKRRAESMPDGEKKKMLDSEFGAVAALLAFGGACGNRSAIKTLARLRVSDFALAENKLHLRGAAGEPFFELTLHPVQTLALAYYRRKLFANEESSDGRGAL